MRKKIVMLLCLSFPVVLFALNENEMDWRYGIYGVRVVTNAPSRHEMNAATNALKQSILEFVYSPSNLPPAQSPAFATNAITVIGPQSNDIASAIAHVADTNLHIAAGERQRIASALTNAAEFASATGGLWTALSGLPTTGDLARVAASAAYAYSPTNPPPQSVSSVNGQTGAVVITAAGIGALTNETDAAALAALAGTNAVLRAAITNEAALRKAHTNDMANPHGVTAAQIGALTNEQDLAALRTYHYGSPEIVESPAEWFQFDGAGTITAFNWEAGRTNVVIPWAIGGVPVTTIGENAFYDMGGVVGFPVTSLIAPQTVTSIGNGAFYCCTSLTSVTIPQATSIGNEVFFGCDALTSVTIPQVTSIGNYAFMSCYLLTSVTIPHVTSIGVEVFSGCPALASVHMGQNAPADGTNVFYAITPPPTVYVTNPQATGWGATWNGAPVVRPPLYADAIYQAGELVATTGHVAQAIAGIPAPPLSDVLAAGSVAETPVTIAKNVAGIDFSTLLFESGLTVSVNGNTVLDVGTGGTGGIHANPPGGIYLGDNPVVYGVSVNGGAALHGDIELTIPEPDLSDRPTFAQIAATNALAYKAWTGTITPVNGTATVAIAHGNMPVLVTSAPCVLTLDPTGYGTAGVSRVSLSYYTGTNSFTFATNVISYAATPTVATNGWNTLLIRRVSNGAWKGVGL